MVNLNAQDWQNIRASLSLAVQFIATTSQQNDPQMMAKIATLIQLDQKIARQMDALNGNTAPVVLSGENEAE